MRHTSSLLFIGFVLFTIIPSILGSCKSAEGDPWFPHPPLPESQRLHEYTPSTPNNDYYDSYYLDVTTYNIQSGLTVDCRLNLEAQAAFLRPFHLYALQEVDINVDLHCNCDQPALMSDATGHNVRFLTHIPYRTGLYGGAVGSVFSILETRYLVFNSWTTEQRGLVAIRSQPPQLAGKTLWHISTHYQFDNVTTRIGQATEVVQFVQQLVSQNPEAYIIVCGDMYAVPGEGSYNVMKGYFKNAWNEFHGGEDGGYTHPVDSTPANRYDHVWYKFPADANPKPIHNVEIPSTRMSDHLPLHVTFDFAIADPTAGPFQPSTGGGATVTPTTPGSSTTGAASTTTTTQPPAEVTSAPTSPSTTSSTTPSPATGTDTTPAPTTPGTVTTTTTTTTRSPMPTTPSSNSGAISNEGSQEPVGSNSSAAAVSLSLLCVVGASLLALLM